MQKTSSDTTNNQAQNNLNKIKEKIKTNPFAELENAPHEVTNDITFMCELMQTVEPSGVKFIFQHANKNVQQNKQFALAALAKNGRAIFRLLDKKLQRDEEIIKQALQWSATNADDIVEKFLRNSDDGDGIYVDPETVIDRQENVNASTFAKLPDIYFDIVSTHQYQTVLVNFDNYLNILTERYEKADGEDSEIFHKQVDELKEIRKKIETGLCNGITNIRSIEKDIAAKQLKALSILKVTDENALHNNYDFDLLKGHPYFKEIFGKCKTKEQFIDQMLQKLIYYFGKGRSVNFSKQIDDIVIIDKNNSNKIWKTSKHNYFAGNFSAKHVYDLISADLDWFIPNQNLKNQTPPPHSFTMYVFDLPTNTFHALTIEYKNNCWVLCDPNHHKDEIFNNLENLVDAVRNNYYSNKINKTPILLKYLSFQNNIDLDKNEQKLSIKINNCYEKMLADPNEAMTIISDGGIGIITTYTPEVLSKLWETAAKDKKFSEKMVKELCKKRSIFTPIALILKHHDSAQNFFDKFILAINNKEHREKIIMDFSEAITEYNTRIKMDKSILYNLAELAPHSIIDIFDKFAAIYGDNLFALIYQLSEEAKWHTEEMSNENSSINSLFEQIFSIKNLKIKQQLINSANLLKNSSAKAFEQLDNNLTYIGVSNWMDFKENLEMQTNSCKII
jgi:hypothetical protein